MPANDLGIAKISELQLRKSSKSAHQTFIETLSAAPGSLGNIVRLVPPVADNRNSIQMSVVPGLRLVLEMPRGGKARAHKLPGDPPAEAKLPKVEAEGVSASRGGQRLPKTE